MTVILLFAPCSSDGLNCKFAINSIAMSLFSSIAISLLCFLINLGLRYLFTKFENDAFNGKKQRSNKACFKSKDFNETNSFI